MRKTTDGWADRVRLAGGAQPFAFRPGEVVVIGATGLDAASRRFREQLGEAEALFSEDGPGAQAFRVRVDLDPLYVVEELRLEGVLAQPNHVVFAHCDCCGPHPAQPCAGMVGAPVYASPVYASPVYASPVYASPVYASPVYASPVYASGQPVVHHSSARPAPAPSRPPRPPAGTSSPRVAVLDTGLAGSAAGDLTPDLLANVAAAPTEWEQPDENGDSLLDPAAGHGTFIAGIIEQIAPGCALRAELVLSTEGDGDEATIAQRIAALDPTLELLNLSFGGYAMEQMFVLAAAIRRVQANGTVVVASAGNDGTCRPTFPAALHDVVGVGALGPHGPAPFTNYGSWVRACAPGVDLVSSFFKSFHGPAPAPTGGSDPDDFASWAAWSGTSFAAPVVVAALAREMQITGCTATEAVASVIDAPSLARLPNLGTVVNV